MRSPEEKREWYLQAMGCSEEDLREGVEESISFSFSGAGMVAMSILSDSQEELAAGMDERARQSINRAKWVISEYLIKDEREAA